MPCFHPLQAFYHSSEVTKSGKPAVYFRRFRTEAHANWSLCERAKHPNFLIPCGRCSGCRLERSRQSAVRCMNEAQMHSANSFITLTYKPERLPSDRSVHYSEFQLFMKRLRHYYDPGIKFFECGEYGGKFRRPHFHACLFGVDFPDKRFWKMSGRERLYISDSLSKLWPDGFSTIGNVSFESAAYVARYVMKKVTGALADEHYEYVNPLNGVLYRLLPEHSKSSNRPGLGRMWYDKYHEDVYPSDCLVVNGKKCKPPRYYDKLLERESPEIYEAVKLERKRKAEETPYDGSRDRLTSKEICFNARMKRLVRTMEDQYDI